MQVAPANVTRHEIQLLMARSKFVRNWTGLSPRSNHAGHLIGSAQLSDESGTFLNGITLDIEIKAPVVTAECLFQFTLRQRIGKMRCRLYQLEVCPGQKRSHNGNPILYGPHEHYGDIEAYAVSDSGVNCSDWDASLRWFLSRINVEYFEIVKPC